ncbi:MAG: DUF3052 domain-containing protein [Actinomycetota bacterium]|nr:DUF3052 domain-containing protein [Actinomycetota bacterium]
MANTADYSHRTAVQKLGVRAGQRVEVAGDVGAELRRGLREALERGFVRSGELDGAIAVVESLQEAELAFAELRPRMHDAAYLWLITWKRGHERYVDQMSLVPPARDHGLIDNKTCSIDDERSGIRFVVPRARRGRGA